MNYYLRSMAASYSTTLQNRLPRFSAEEDSVIIHEVYATRAFCALKNVNFLYAKGAKTLKDSPVCQGKLRPKVFVTDSFI